MGRRSLALVLALALGLPAGACARGGGAVPAGQWRVYRARAGVSAPSRGTPTGRVVMELFSDFECVFCGRVDPTIEALFARYGSELQLVWRDYPLPRHRHALLAAEAAREVYAQLGDAGFWRYHDTLFGHQDALERADLERFAAALECDMDRFRAALDDHRHRAGIAADVAAADAAGVEMGTPAFFINGRFLSGALPVGDFAPVIEDALAHAH